ncbi:MAG: PIN domain-containing protein [Terrimicrobiaceae bacterium]
MSEILVDTGPLVGWINKRDQWHDWSVAVLSDLVPPLLTCEAVIAEAVWHLHSSQIAVDQLYGLVSDGALRIVDLLPDHALHIRALSAKYREMDFCDAAMVRLSEIFPKAKLITTDTAHFQIYRRFLNQTIPLIHP